MGKILTIVLKGLIAAAAIVLIVNGLSGHNGSHGNPNFPEGGPAEFLYLDNARVAAYLGQINGGSFDKETIKNTATDSVNAKLSVPGTGEGGGEHSEESFVEREVKPTQASRFFALYQGMKQVELIVPVRLRHFEEDLEGRKEGESDENLEGLEEGEFVSFKTTALRSPIYLNAYLASRRPATLTALFPGGATEQLKAKSTAERHASRRFVKRLGKNPRFVFSLHPEEAIGENAEAAPKPFVYLLPMSAAQLTEERSLLKYGGGQFTVFGKVVRIFPELQHDHDPAYVDSPTLETWEQPIKSAPGELICRTDPRCAKNVRREKLRGGKRRREIKASRTRELAALHEQTVIGQRGAVIIPVGIYK
jgi:hypothetical protein